MYIDPKQFNIERWTISNRTDYALRYPITGVSLSPIKKDCILLYVKIPEEVKHLHFPVRQKLIDKLGFDEPNENVEEDYPLIIMNKFFSSVKASMSLRMKYSFYRNFKREIAKSNIDAQNINSARHLIGKKIETRFIQLRKLNSDQRFWSPDRVGITIA